jgi:putative endonuclease
MQVKHISKTESIPKLPEQKWYIYLVRCQDNSLYAGVTNNILRRMKTHKTGRGSKYIKAKGFGKLLKFKKCRTKREAYKYEYQVKQMKGQYQKLNWFMD